MKRWGKKFDVCGIVKPGAPLSEIIKDALSLTKDSDAVIIVWGTNGTSGRKKVGGTKDSECEKPIRVSQNSILLD